MPCYILIVLLITANRLGMVIFRSLMSLTVQWSGFIFVTTEVKEQLMVGFVQPGVAGATSETVTLQIQQRGNILGCIQLCSLQELLGATCQDVMGIFPSLLMFCHVVLRNKATKMPQINWGSRWLIYYLLPSKCPTFSPDSGWTTKLLSLLFSLLLSCWHILRNPHCWRVSERLFLEDLWFSDFCAVNHGSRVLSWQF